MAKRKKLADVSMMPKRLDANAFGHAFGVVLVVAIIFYAIIVWFSGYDASVIVQQFPLDFSFSNWTLLIGLIESYVFGYLAGYIVARVYNKVLRS